MKLVLILLGLISLHSFAEESIPTVAPATPTTWKLPPLRAQQTQRLAKTAKPMDTPTFSPSALHADEIELDLSWVLEGSPQAFIKTFLDFDHYKEKNIPNIVESHIVDQKDHLLYVHSHMQFRVLIGAGFTLPLNSNHFLEIRHETLKENKAFGIQWQNWPKDPKWKDPEDSLFKTLQGTLYLQPLPSEPNKFYVRYWLKGQLELGKVGAILPDGLLSSLGPKTKEGIIGYVEKIQTYSNPTSKKEADSQPHPTPASEPEKKAESAK